MDKISKEKRSKIMSAIHSKDTRPEIALRAALSAKKMKFETNYGTRKIDIAFPEERLAIFVDGCFWHGCPIHSHIPATNRDYWLPKLNRNKERDRETTARLTAQGWMVMRFWEHELENLDRVTLKIQKGLKNVKNAEYHKPRQELQPH